MPLNEQEKTKVLQAIVAASSLDELPLNMATSLIKAMEQAPELFFDPSLSEEQQLNNNKLISHISSIMSMIVEITNNEYSTKITPFFKYLANNRPYIFSLMVLKLIDDSHKKCPKNISEYAYSMFSNDILEMVGKFRNNEAVPLLMIGDILKTFPEKELYRYLADFAHYTKSNADRTPTRNQQNGILIITDFLKEIRKEKIKHYKYADIITAECEEANVLSDIALVDQKDFMQKIPEIPEDQNPILLAIKYGKIDILLAAHRLSGTEPWLTAWSNFPPDYDVESEALNRVGALLISRDIPAQKTVGLVDHIHIMALQAKQQKFAKQFAAFHAEVLKNDFNSSKITQEHLDKIINFLTEFPQGLNAYFANNDKTIQNIFVLDNNYDRNNIAKIVSMALDQGGKEFTDKLFAYLIKTYPDYMQRLIQGSELAEKQKDAAWEYVRAHFGEYFASLKDDPSKASAIQKLLKDSSRDLQPSTIFPFITDLPTQLELMQALPDYSTQEIDPLENPIILAAQHNRLSFLLHAYDNKDNEPWKAYWDAVGESTNTVLAYFMKQPMWGNVNIISKQKIAEILNYLCDKPQVILHVNNDFFVGLKTYLREVQEAKKDTHTKRLASKKDVNIIQENVNKLIKQLAPAVDSKNFMSQYIPATSLQSNNFLVQELFLEKLYVEQNVENYSFLTGEESANDVNFADLMMMKFIDKPVASNELLKRYTDKDQGYLIESAQEDMRRLLLKMYIENIPQAGTADYRNWEKLLNLCGLDVNRVTEISNMSFAEFKKLIPTLSSKEIIESLISGYEDNLDGTKKLKLAELENLIHGDNLRISEKDDPWQYNVTYSWCCFDPLNGQHKNFKNNTLKFVLFCMLRATEDIDKLLADITDKSKLLKLMERATATQRLKVEQLSNIKDAKGEVRAYLIGEQKTMQGGMMAYAAEAWMANSKNGSCSTGIYTRFGKNVLNFDFKYSLVKGGDRSALIKDIVLKKFAAYVNDKIVSMLIANLKEKLSHSSRATFTQALRDQKQSLDPEKRLMAALKTLDLETKAEVLGNLLGPDDPAIQNFLDALLSVSNNNWPELFVGPKKIQKFSSVINRDTSENGYIDISGFKPNKYNRSTLLADCFKNQGYISIQQYVSDNLASLYNESADLTKIEYNYIRYYTSTLGNTKELTKIGEKSYAIMRDIRASLAPTTANTAQADATTFKLLADTVRQYYVPANEPIQVINPVKTRPNSPKFFFSFPFRKKRPPSIPVQNLTSTPKTLTPVDLKKIRDLMFNVILSLTNNNLSQEIKPEDINDYKSELNFKYLTDKQKTVIGTTLSDLQSYQESNAIDTIEDSLNKCLHEILRNKDDLNKLNAALTEAYPDGFIKFMTESISAGQANIDLPVNIADLLQRIHKLYAPSEIFAVEEVKKPPVTPEQLSVAKKPPAKQTIAAKPQRADGRMDQSRFTEPEPVPVPSGASNNVNQTYAAPSAQKSFTPAANANVAAPTPKDNAVNPVSDNGDDMDMRQRIIKALQKDKRLRLSALKETITPPGTNVGVYTYPLAGNTALSRELEAANPNVNVIIGILVQKKLIPPGTSGGVAAKKL